MADWSGGWLGDGLEVRLGRDEERLGRLVSRGRGRGEWLVWRIDWAGEEERFGKLARRMVWRIDRGRKEKRRGIMVRGMV